MAGQHVTLRLEDDTKAWVDEYAKERGVSRTDLLVSAIESFRKDCESGVPELRRLAREQTSVKEDGQGVGDCPGRPDALGHLWQVTDGVSNCRFCPMLGRAHLDQATADRVELFSKLRMPKSAHGKAKT